jgi:GLPGLI family protein
MKWRRFSSNLSKPMKVFQFTVVSLLLLATSIASVSCNSSKGTSKSKGDLFEGKIDFKITYDLPEEYKSQAGLLDSVLTTYIGAEFTRIEQQTQNGTQISIYNFTTKSNTILMDIMGKKIAILTEDPPVEEQPKYEIKEIDEKKEIAGFKCKKAIFTATKGENKSDYIIFYSEKISPEANSQFPGLKGFPLEYTITTQGVPVTYRAEKLTEMEVVEELKVVPEGYESMSVEEFMQLMGGG